jgi:hypothetical protein
MAVQRCREHTCIFMNSGFLWAPAMMFTSCTSYGTCAPAISPQNLCGLVDHAAAGLQSRWPEDEGYACRMTMQDMN